MASSRPYDVRPLILIADHSVGSLTLAAHVLGDAGFATETAWDGRQVVALALILQPAVIVMSTKLAYVTGCQATRILKKDVATRHPDPHLHRARHRPAPRLGRGLRLRRLAPQAQPPRQAG